MLAEFIMVSISPTLKLAPGPVSFIRSQEFGALPAGPAELSSNTVVQPVPAPTARSQVGHRRIRVLTIRKFSYSFRS